MKHTGKNSSKSKSIANVAFIGWLSGSLSLYAGFIVLLILANVAFVLFEFKDGTNLAAIFSSPEIIASVKLTLVSTCISTLLAMLVSIPAAFVLSHVNFKGKRWVDALVDVPMVMPPLVVGVSLLILFNAFPFGIDDGLAGQGWNLESMMASIGINVTHTALAVILAQFTITTAYATRIMRSVFETQDTRLVEISRTLGAKPWQRFLTIHLPQARGGVVAATTLAWAKSLGEFGPILIFAGATRGKTEVLATSVYLELNTGNLVGAVAISLMMICIALSILFIVKIIGKYKF